MIKHLLYILHPQLCHTTSPQHIFYGLSEHRNTVMVVRKRRNTTLSDIFDSISMVRRTEITIIYRTYKRTKTFFLRPTVRTDNGLASIVFQPHRMFYFTHVSVRRYSMYLYSYSLYERQRMYRYTFPDKCVLG